MNGDDHLSPEPLESYSEHAEEQSTQAHSENLTSEEQYRLENLDVAGPFRKIDLEWQKQRLQAPMQSHTMKPQGHDYSQFKKYEFEKLERQIKYQETVLHTNKSKARDAFNVKAKSVDRGLDR